MLNFLANQRFQPTIDAAQDTVMLADEFDEFLGVVSPVHDGTDLRRMRRIVLVTGEQDSLFGFQVALSLAKKSHLLVDLLEITQGSDDVNAVIPEIVTLNAAGIRFEHHSHTGGAADWLPDYLTRFDDTVAVIAEEGDLHRDGVLRLDLPVLRGLGLPALFVVAGKHLRLPSA